MLSKTADDVIDFRCVESADNVVERLSFEITHDSLVDELLRVPMAVVWVDIYCTHHVKS